MSRFASLQSSLTGTLRTRDEVGYTESAASFNPMIRHAPDAVVCAANEQDVVETIRFARENRLPVHLHSTGHGTPFAFMDGIVLVLSALDAVEVDPDARTATIGGGAPWSRVVEAAAPFDLAPIIGSSPGVGAVGFLLGGGVSGLARSHGFAADRVVSARVVSGAGEVVDASPDGDQELFWALRGGKLGLGVVTEITVSLIEAPSLYAGSLTFDLDESTYPFERWLEWTAVAPPEVTTTAVIFRFPDQEPIPAPMRGRNLLRVQAAYVGPADEGERLTAGLRALGHVVSDDLGPMALTDVGTIANDPTEPMPVYMRGATLTSVGGDFAKTLLGLVGPGSRLPIFSTQIRHVGGAMREVAGGSTAVGYRDFDYAVFTLGVPVPALFETVMPQAFAAYEAALAPWISPHLTPNWIDDFRGTTQISATWPPETLQRLASVRALHDPDQIFA
jgi:hypothetical protein